MKHLFILLLFLAGCASTEPRALADSPTTIDNIGLAQSISGTNDLVISLKTKSGGDPSSVDPVKVAFRNTNGGYDTVDIISALSVTFVDGALLGLPNGEDNYLYAYLLNNSGTAEMVLTSQRVSDNSIRNTAIANATSDGRLLYSTTARTSVPVRLLGAVKIKRSGTGFWQTATDIQTVPFTIRREVHCLLTRISAVWTCLDSSAHRMVGVANVVNGSTYATINFDFTAQNVISIQITPNKVYMSNGLFASWSPLAVDKVTIWFHQLQSGVMTGVSSSVLDISGGNFSITAILEE